MSTTWLECESCHTHHAAHLPLTECPCGGLLSLERAAGWSAGCGPEQFDARRADGRGLWQSGVWRFREAVMPARDQDVVSHPEGATRLYERPALSAYGGVEHLWFKHEGENPTGSFKDRGMTAAVTQARVVGARAIACASTGNTSASLAAYAAQAGLSALVFVPSGKIAVGKLAQTLAYGARCLKVRGDFDAAMRLVREACQRLGIYLVNSVNPFRIEGQKTIFLELLQDLRWDAPDWIALPAGNLGNTAACGKALREAHAAGWIRKVPRILAVQARGANPFARGFAGGFAARERVQAETVASAIRIGDPVSWERAKAAVRFTQGVVTDVTDEELLLAKAQIDGAGVGCEPASACSLAGVRQQRAAGVIRPTDRVVCILTGHVLKDPDTIMMQAGSRTDQVVEVDPTLDAVRAVVDGAA